MKKIFLFLIFALSKCAPPPIPEPMDKILSTTPKFSTKNSKTDLSFRNLKDLETTLLIMNSTATITYYENYQKIDHQITLIPYNLSENICLNGWELNILINKIDNISTKCEIINNISKKDCIAYFTFSEFKITFNYNGRICNGDNLIVNYKYNKKKIKKEILYKQEMIQIPLIKNSLFCNYKYIIPDKYIYLGLKDNSLTLTKESENTYSYNGLCPYNQTKNEFRYSPEKAFWKADIKISLEYPPKFKCDVIFQFSRCYRGGKFRNEYYKISSTVKDSYNENDIARNDTEFFFITSAKNKEKMEVELHTVFSNKLTDEFLVYLPEKYYEINLSEIDQKIIDKAKEIIKEDSNKPNYYKIGKFVNSYIEYDSDLLGKELSLKKIFDGKKGVCEHYTLLYNAMLNAIGIKAIEITGWAFNGKETSSKWDVGHAWTVALINGKWMELDATWGLFEGISAGHIMKTYVQDYYYYFYPFHKVKFELTHNIKMISINQDEEIYKQFSLVEGICLGIFIILCALFYHIRKKNKNKFHSKLIEEIKI